MQKNFLLTTNCRTKVKTDARGNNKRKKKIKSFDVKMIKETEVVFFLVFEKKITYMMKGL